MLFEIATIGPGLHRRRAVRDARRVAVAAAELRAATARRSSRSSTPLPNPRGRVIVTRAARGRRGRRRARPPARSRRRRARPLPAARRARPGAAARTATRPRGPLALPPGGAHWYVVPRVGYPGPRDVRASYARGSSTWLDSLPYERIVLGGFSQGCVMSLALGLGAAGRGRSRSAASRASSRVVDGWALDTSRPLPPVALGHGTLRPGDPRRVRPHAHATRCSPRAARCSTASTRSRTRSTRAVPARGARLARTKLTSAQTACACMTSPPSCSRTRSKPLRS